MNGGPTRLLPDVTDEAFNAMYPRNIGRIAEKHFTPVAVAKTASEFLVTSADTKVLDIGSGAGKFCMVGAMHTAGHFTGIEQRTALVELSKRLSGAYALRNISFIIGNVTSVRFSDFNAFYIYNSFYENIDVRDSIDNSVVVNPPLYNAYLNYTLEQLSSLARGTRLATYYTTDAIVPSSFELVNKLYEGKLNFWIKER